MANVLGIDTATPDTAVAVTGGGEVLAESVTAPGPDGRPRHGTAALAEAENAVSAAGGWESVGLIAVGLGPGSFTGLRIGVATARALAQSSGLPIAGVSSLAALGRGIGESAAAAKRPRLAAIDARRGELFAALYGPDGSELMRPFVVNPELVGPGLARAEIAPLAAGDGAVRFRQELEAAGAEVPPDDDPIHRISARHICVLGDEGAPGGPEGIEPLYLRAPDAEVWLERDGR